MQMAVGAMKNASIENTYAYVYETGQVISSEKKIVAGYRHRVVSTGYR